LATINVSLSGNNKHVVKVLDGIFKMEMFYMEMELLTKNHIRVESQLQSKTLKATPRPRIGL